MMITSLKSNEVFVFGSNAQGFHGAGSAGYAMRGDTRNNWRQDKTFRRAMEAPVGHPDRVGKWAVFGVARGFSKGHEGISYAIQTIEKPGRKRSTSRQDICIQLGRLSVQEVWIDWGAEPPREVADENTRGWRIIQQTTTLYKISYGRITCYNHPEQKWH